MWYVAPLLLVFIPAIPLQNLARQYALAFGKDDSVKRPNVITSSNSTLVVSTAFDDGEPSTNIQENTEFTQRPRGYFADQFENRSNYDAHFEGTGPEIWRQTNGHLNAFVAGAGTGGTIAGIGQFIKSMDEDVQVVLADPEGSGLYNKVKFDVMYNQKESEGTKRRHQVDTVVEGM